MENNKYGELNPNKKISTVFDVDYLYPEDQKPKSEIEIWEEFKSFIRKQSIEIKLLYFVFGPLFYYHHRRQYRTNESLLLSIVILICAIILNVYIFIPALLLFIAALFIGVILGVLGISFGIAYYMVRFFFSLFRD